MKKKLERNNILTGTKWEKIHGYSRAVKIGNQIFVSGTTSVDNNGNIIGFGDVYEQTKYILQKIAFALRDAKATLEDVVRTRIYTTDINNWEEISKAHKEFFGEILPASTMVEVNKLIDNNLLVEIEAEAVITTKEREFNE